MESITMDRAGVRAGFASRLRERRTADARRRGRAEGAAPALSVAVQPDLGTRVLHPGLALIVGSEILRLRGAGGEAQCEGEWQGDAA